MVWKKTVAASLSLSIIMGCLTPVAAIVPAAAFAPVSQADGSVSAVIGSEAEATAAISNANEGDIAKAPSVDAGVSDVAAFIHNLYINVLGREPDSEGFNYWISGLSARTIDGAHAAYGFIFSEEYISRNDSDEDYVRMLYRTILGREADEKGLSSWKQTLEWGGTREGVFAGFVRSQEFKDSCAKAGFNAGVYYSESIYDTNVFVTGFVKRMYTECLERKPDKNGWESWIRILLDGGTGAKLAKGFFMSPEVEEMKLSSEEFVRRLYRTILDRNPDVNGQAAWINALDELGKTRLYVLRGFVASDEFTALCKAFGVERGDIDPHKKPAEEPTVIEPGTEPGMDEPGTDNPGTEPGSEPGDEPGSDEPGNQTPGMLEPGIHQGINIFYDQGGPIIVIDPGHQDHAMTAKEQNGPGSSTMKMKATSGTEGVATGVPEYKLNLEVSLLIRDELLARGYSVVMIRETNNVDISNMERALIANSYDTAVYLHVHANSDDNSNIHGVMTICQTRNNPYVADMYGINNRLSQTILDSVVAATGARDSGIWETDTMTGLNWSRVPTTFLEMGFMSNAAEDRRMQQEDYQLKIANGVANGIDSFLKG